MSIFPEELLKKAELILQFAREKENKNCQRGILHRRAYKRLPYSYSWSSDVFDSGFATYSNASKTNSIGVPAETIKTFGAVSNETAMEMAMGAAKTAEAQIAISTTGIAGPDGGSAEKPVGLVYIGFYLDNPPKIYALKNYFEGSRSEVRMQTLETALDILKEELEKF